jgi:acetyl-CoA carboxylase alpha subunit
LAKVQAGGALALGLGNKVLMLENAIYSILSPEGYASILWKDSSRIEEAAEKMKLTAKDLYDLNVIDKIIKEPSGDLEKSFETVCKNLKKEITNIINEMSTLDSEQLVEERYKKFRNMGEYINLDSSI